MLAYGISFFFFLFFFLITYILVNCTNIDLISDNFILSLRILYMKLMVVKALTINVEATSPVQLGLFIIKRPARDACLCMGELQAPPAPHFVFLITL